MIYTTKYGLAEQILLRVRNQVIPGEVDLSMQEVILYVSQNIGNVVKAFLLAQQDEMQEVDGSLSYTFSNIKVQGDKTKYAILPAIPIGLPMGRGIQEVCFDDDSEQAMIPLPSNYKTLYGNLASSSLQGQVGYYYKQDKLYFYNYPNLDTEQTVSISMVAPINGLDTDDTFTLLPEVQEMLVKEAVNFFGAPAPPEDQLNDNV